VFHPEQADVLSDPAQGLFLSICSLCWFRSHPIKSGEPSRQGRRDPIHSLWYAYHVFGYEPKIEVPLTQN
jgi:hypothetical protein